MPVYDCNHDNTALSSSTEITVQSDVPNNETSTIPDTTGDTSQLDRSCDGTDPDPYIEPDADTRVEQPNPRPTNPAAQSRIYVIIQSRTAKMILDPKTSH